MPLKDELSRLDTAKVAEIFNDLFDPEDQPLEVDPLFLGREVNASSERFPVFKAVAKKFEDFSQHLREAGVPEEKIRGVFWGIYMTQLILTTFADREVPDGIDPEVHGS